MKCVANNHRQWERPLQTKMERMMMIARADVSHHNSHHVLTSLITSRNDDISESWKNGNVILHACHQRWCEYRTIELVVNQRAVEFQCRLPMCLYVSALLRRIPYPEIQKICSQRLVANERCDGGDKSNRPEPARRRGPSNTMQTEYYDIVQMRNDNWVIMEDNEGVSVGEPIHSPTISYCDHNSQAPSHNPTISSSQSIQLNHHDASTRTRPSLLLGSHSIWLRRNQLANGNDSRLCLQPATTGTQR